MSSVIFVIIMFLFWLVPAAAFGQWWLFAVFMIFGIVFGIVELVCSKVTGDSISEIFWKWSGKNIKRAWILLVCMLIGWLMLLVHLGEKMVSPEDVEQLSKILMG